MPANPYSVEIIHNPKAGRRQARHLAEFTRALTGHDLHWRLQSTTHAGHATSLASESPARIVVAAGGDGTLHEVLNGLMQQPPPRPDLAFLPLGTANVAAYEAGIVKHGPAELARLLAATQPTPISVGQVNSRYFLQMTGIGFDAHIVANVSPALKRLFGKSAYVWRALVEWLRYRPRQYHLTSDGQTETAAAVMVANGRAYVGPFSSAPQARWTTPELHICIFRRPGRWPLLRYCWALLTNRLQSLQDIQVVTATQLRINTTGQATSTEPLQCDGELAGALPADFQIHPGALRFFIASAP